MFDYEIEHNSFVRKNLGGCVVLLRKDGSFPLDAPCRLALFGSGARRTVFGGTGSGEVNSHYRVSIEDGLRQAGFEITSGEWLDAYDSVTEKTRKDFILEVKRRARAEHRLAVIEGMGSVCPEPEYELPLSYDADAAIYVLSRISGEGNDRAPIKGDILPTDTEIGDITRLAEKYEKFMLVLNVGGPVDLSAFSSVPNILYLSQLGAECGSALADIILGKSYPSGKLTTTFSALEDYPDIPFGDRYNTPYEEDIYVGYRYFSTVGKRALFPFGFGLSYTDFSLKVTDSCVDDGMVTVKVRVENIGSYKGKEVVQVYISCPDGKLRKPALSLAAFKKTKELIPAEVQTLTLCFDIRDQASFDTERGAFALEGGEYRVYAGNSSVSLDAALDITVTDEMIIRRVKSIPGAPDMKTLSLMRAEIDIGAAERRAVISELSGIGECVDYTCRDRISDKARALSDKELATLLVGAHKGPGGAFSVIGNASTAVAGAAGETTSALNGIPSLILSDGPAGLRISPVSYIDKRGAHSLGEGGLPKNLTDYMPKALVGLINLLGAKKKEPKDKSKIIYRYATALPIGTAIANSFDPELAESFGDIIGDEMERFGIHIWLAPALNIHRSIRCGRNFEYYSEDPLVSGVIAGAIARGVEKHPGAGVCYKHYAANNQETCRYSNNSIVTERAQREIYLRAFEIAIREHNPAAVMTSYNLLSGTHTAESVPLIRDVLRYEFGFSGIVMTDWIVNLVMADRRSPHKSARADRIAAAGTELVMPGARGDVRRILKALKRGTLNREVALVCATRLLDTIERLTEKKDRSAPEERELACAAD